MTSLTLSSSKRSTRVLALLIAAGLAVFTFAPALAQLPPLPPVPPVPPLPPLPTLPVPPLDLRLGVPELPHIPSLPQILPSNAPTRSGSTQLPVTSATIDAKLLIISADGSEPVLGAIRQAADYAGLPYTLYIASQTPGGFTPAMLSDGNSHAFYQGIVLTTGALGYQNGGTWTSAFNTTEWQTLWDYQAKYRVRTGIGYVFPTEDLGYGPGTGVDATTTPISASLTSAGRTVFPYVNSANPIVITRAWAYLARPAGTGVSPLLTDTNGNALALVRTYPDGREVLSMTFDGNFFLVHSLALGYGLMNWVTGGLFLGERHVHMAAQVDDIFLDNDVYGGTTYRLTGADWAVNNAWQAQKQQQSQTANLHIHMAFNGEGTTGTYSFDTLTPAVDLTDFQYPWINHTFTHENLDAVTYAVAYQEITRNNQTAASMGFANYDRRALVTPDVSGLNNINAMRAAYDAGVRFLVTDTSQPGMNNPTPQAGIYNSLVPGILMVPRRPVNLFYNVTTPTEWKNEYNYIYHTYWGRDLTYSEIVDKESEVLLQYMLRGEIDPWMFHQANLRAYDNVHTLLGDLLDRTLQKYGKIFTLPVNSLTMAALGEWTANRMRYNAAGVRASFQPSQGTISITATQAAVVPVTGLCSDSSEVYGGQCISYVAVGPGQTVVRHLQNNGQPTNVLAATDEIPQGAAIEGVSPNPFTNSTAITLALPRPAQSRLIVYDVSGRVVRNLLDRMVEAGVHTITWDGSTDASTPAPGGLYFAKLESGGRTTVRRITLLK